MKLVQSFLVIIAVVVFSGCLKTRSEVSPTEQSYIARKKQQQESQRIDSTSTEVITDPQETIRALNGRIEVLENQVNILQAQKENSLAATAADAQKIATLQEALARMETQIQKLETEKQLAKTSDENLKQNELVNTPSIKGKRTSYDIAEELFGKKEWKRAILSYQKFAEEFPKSKLVPDAKYKTGVAFQELGLKDEALAFYEEVSVQYPQTLAGKKSKIRISNLNKPAGKSKKK